MCIFEIDVNLQGRFPPHAVQTSERARKDRNYNNWSRAGGSDDRSVREDIRKDFLRDDDRRLDNDNRDRFVKF